MGKFFEKKGKDDGSFISIEEKISKRFGQVIMLCCIILGVVTSILSYISSISAVSETINDTSDVAANYVSASLKEFTAIAYETGSIAREALHALLIRKGQWRKRRLFYNRGSRITTWRAVTFLTATELI